MQQFKSSYYLLFLLQWFADLYVFVVAEFLGRARRYNLLDLFSVNDHTLALISIVCVLSSKPVIYFGHVVIAFNRMTAICWPLDYEKIWSVTRILITYPSGWCFITIPIIVAVQINAGSTKFYYMSDGTLHLTAGTSDTLFTTITCITSGTVVIICSTCYISAVYKHRRANCRIQAKNLEWRLLISALVSSVGALIDFIGLLISLLADINTQHGRLVFTVVTDLGYIQFELAATMTVWIHLLLVKNVRLLMFPKLCGGPKPSNVARHNLVLMLNSDC
ncbi:hypothetical protein Q1695_007029 [Nippostrongylus brasiliensis]|nr:hypothetical protein Q1695_007029 [Nippostrongylus brasiliensis]